MARSISVFHLGEDASGKIAYLIPKEQHTRRIELTANTMTEFTVPAGVRRVIFMYESDDFVYMIVNPTADMTAVPSGNITSGEAPFINPIGLSGFAPSDRLQMISPSAGAVHLICGG